MYQDPNINKKGYIYGKWMTQENTYTISFGNMVFSYLLIGEEKALLIDTAYGEGNLRHFVEQITDKPVLVVNTHEHFDHTGGNPWWKEAYASEKAVKGIKKAFSPEIQEAFNQKPYPDYKINYVSEGYEFDLGGRIVEVLDIPAHCQSSIALLDKTYKALYTGDEIEAGQVLMFGEESIERFKQHQENMKKLKSRSGEFDFMYPAHNGNPINKKYIDDFIELDQQMINGTQKNTPTTAGFGFPPKSEFLWDGRKMARAEFGGASFCYTIDQK